jgi:hypothetical protein
VRRVSVSRVLAYLLHEAGDDARRNLIDSIVIIAELGCRGIIDVLIVNDQSVLVAHDANLSVLDRAQAVGDHRKAGDPERHRSQNVAIVKRHFEALVEVLVVHIVDTIHRMHISAGKPFHGLIEFGHDVVEVEDVAGNRQCLGGDLIAGYLIPTAIDRIEQRLREVDAGAKELHLLAESHGRDAAGDAVVVPPEGAHQIVVFVLQRGGVLADLHAVAFERGRHVLRP